MRKLAIVLAVVVAVAASVFLAYKTNQFCCQDPQCPPCRVVR